MNEIKVFENEQFGSVRTIEENGKVLFCASDIAKALGYARPNDAISAHCRATVKRSTPISGKMQEINFIPEGDVYRLIVKSHLPEAEKFESWVFDEVLPSIRKHGAYMTPEVIEQTLLNPDFIIRLATTLKEEREKNSRLEQKIEEDKPLVDFAEQVYKTDDLIDVNDMAKLLKRDGINIGRNKLFEWMRNKKLLMTGNQPYQKFINCGYFKVKEVVKTSVFGDKVFTKTYITGKGQLYIATKLRDDLGYGVAI